MPKTDIPAKFADLSHAPVGAAVHVKLDDQDCPWSMEIPIQQGLDMEADGFTVHWLMPKAGASTAEQNAGS